MPDATHEFAKLLGLMRTLRAPGGCPWDREQTLDSLRKYVVEETYEVIDAIDRRDWDGLAEELGDLQLQIVFQAEIACEEGLFDIVRVLDHINDKLIRRHPHVFDQESLATAEAVTKRWEELKAKEKAATPRFGRLDAVQRAQPALMEAQQIGKKAAEVGFDWQTFEDLGKKLVEEFREVGAARRARRADRLEEEVGDLLFMAVNVARFVGVDSETALKRANLKFRKRFGDVERALDNEKRTFEQCPPEELDALWQRAKQN